MPGMLRTLRHALQERHVPVGDVREPGVPEDARPSTARLEATRPPAEGVADTMGQRTKTPHPGPGRRPGARKPGAKGKTVDNMTADERAEYRRQKMQARIGREVAAFDFSRRTADLRRLNMPYVEIARVMSEERGEPISTDMVRNAFLKQARNVDALDDYRYAELDKLEQTAAGIVSKIIEMDDLPVAMLDIELYTKLCDSYLKYRERVAKLVGLDAATKTQIERKGDAPPMPAGNNGGSVEIDASGNIRVNMPGSVAAYAEWAELDEVGMIGLAGEVLELESSDHEEIPVGLHASEMAGVTLRPDIDVTPGAEAPDKQQEIASALEALALFQGNKT